DGLCELPRIILEQAQPEGQRGTGIEGDSHVTKASSVTPRKWQHACGQSCVNEGSLTGIEELRAHEGIGTREPLRPVRFRGLADDPGERVVAEILPLMATTHPAQQAPQAPGERC